MGPTMVFEVRPSQDHLAAPGKCLLDAAAFATLPRDINTQPNAEALRRPGSGGPDWIRRRAHTALWGRLRGANRPKF
jgi:hypothetical protein